MSDQTLFSTSPIPVPKILAISRKHKELPTVEKAKRMVQVLVHKKPFFLHENFLFYYSLYFEAVFKRTLAVDDIQAVEYNDARPEVFSIFATWVYTQHIVNKEEKEILPCETLVDLWILGQKIHCPRLQNQALKALDRARMETNDIPSALLKDVYENTTWNSPLRKYLLDYYSRRSKGLFSPQNYPPEFLFDMINAMKAQRRKDAEVPEGHGFESSRKGLKRFYVPDWDGDKSAGMDNGQASEFQGEGSDDEVDILLRPKKSKKSSKRRADVDLDNEASNPAKKRGKKQQSRHHQDQHQQQ